MNQDRSVMVTCPNEDCGHVHFEVPVFFEPAEPNYGADADGNRGMYIGAYFAFDVDELPAACATCAHVFTEDERAAIAREAGAACEALGDGSPVRDDDPYTREDWDE